MDQIINTAGENLAIGYKPKWESLDSYSRLKVSQKLRNFFEGFCIEIQKWNELALSQATLTKEATSILADKLKEAFPQSFISQEGGKTWLLLERQASGGKTQIELEKWAEMFGPVILSRKSGHELCEALCKYSEARKWGHERHIRPWYSECPQIFENLPHAADMTIPVELDTATNEVNKQREAIVEVALKVKKELEKEINKVW